LVEEGGTDGYFDSETAGLLAGVPAASEAETEAEADEEAEDGTLMPWVAVLLGVVAVIVPVCPLPASNSS